MSVVRFLAVFIALTLSTMVRAQVLPANAALCAAEHEICQISNNQPATVYYGSGEDWNVRTNVSGSISCSNAVFGDPIRGTFKACYYVAESQEDTQDNTSDSVNDSVSGSGDTYFVDASGGNDANNGLSENSPWRTFANINNKSFSPGDSILLRRGRAWTGTIELNGSGAPGDPIVLGSYGTGAKPIVNGNGRTDCSVIPNRETNCTIHLHNEEYWTIRDLEITNYDPSEENGRSLAEWESRNISNYANVSVPSLYTGNNSNKTGILVEANDAGKLSQLHFLDLEIHGVNGNIHEKDNGGIFIEVFDRGGDTPTYFDDILVEDSHIHDVDRTGLSNVSSYDDRERFTNDNWTPNTNYVVRNTLFERTGANALIVRVSTGALIENSHFRFNAIKESGNASFNFNTDGTVWQYNLFENTKANEGDRDAGGVDSDFRSKDTIIQYNHLRDNDYGMLVTGGPGRFNDNTVVRYNIFERDGQYAHPSDGKFVLKTSGSASNTVFHNNAVYVDSTKSNLQLTWEKTWAGASPDETKYYNNIFYDLGSNSRFSPGNGTNAEFSNNLYFGNIVDDLPPDSRAVVGDPMWTDPGGGEDGYQIQSSQSSAIGRGRDLPTIPTEDFYGNSISDEFAITIGIEQHDADAVGQPSAPVLTVFDYSKFNPVEGVTIFPVGEYDDLGRWDNDIGSLRVPAGLRVKVCNDAEGTSNCLTLTDDVADLPSVQNNRISYMLIEEI